MYKVNTICFYTGDAKPLCSPTTSARAHRSAPPIPHRSGLLAPPSSATHGFHPGVCADLSCPHALAAAKKFEVAPSARAGVLLAVEPRGGPADREWGRPHARAGQIAPQRVRGTQPGGAAHGVRA